MKKISETDLDTLGLLQGRLHHGLLGLLHPAHSEIHTRTHLLDLDPRQALSALLGP